MSDLYNKNVMQMISQFQKNLDLLKISMPSPPSGVLALVNEVEKIQRNFTVPLIYKAPDFVSTLNTPKSFETINKYFQRSSTDIAGNLVLSMTETLSAWDTLSLSRTLQNTANIFEKYSQSEEVSDNEYIDIPESFVKTLSDIDANLEFPKANSDKTVRLSKTTSSDFIAIIALIVAIFQLTYSIYSDLSSTALSKQQHKEAMEQDQIQHEETMRQDRIQHEEAMQQNCEQHEESMREERKQTQLLRQIKKNTSSNNVQNSKIGSKPQ